MEEARKIYDEIVDLFARGATSAEVLAFSPSERTQERVRELLMRCKSDELTEQEVEVLERYGKCEQLMQLVKARAHLYIDDAL